MNTPNRKPTRIKDYDYSQEGCYFITLCTYQRAKLFHMEDSAGEVFGPEPDSMIANQIIQKWIIEMQRKFPNITIDNYVIMPDHIHLLITITERHIGRSLQKIMQFFKTMTTNEYIRGVKCGALPRFNKKLWQKSYYDHVIRNQQDYNESWQYIENNPIKWLIVHDS